MIRVAGIQIAPVFLDAKKTWRKLSRYIEEACKEGSDIITWAESLIPGYPVWVSSFDGAKWDYPPQKKVYAKHWSESIDEFFNYSRYEKHSKGEQCNTDGRSD